MSKTENGFYFDEESGRYFTIFQPSSLELWLTSIIGYLICFVSLALYLRVSYIIFKLKSNYFSNSFYTLLLYLSVADCSFLIIQLTVGYLVPLIGFKNVPHNLIAAFGFIIILANLVIPQLVILIAFNRYVCVCHFDKYKIIFGHKSVHLIVSICFTVALVLTCFFYACTCFAYKVSYFWEISCYYRNCANIIYYLGFFSWGFLCVLVPFVYIVFYCNYRWRKYKLAKSMEIAVRIETADLMLLFQSFIISSVLVLYFILFFVQSRIQSSFTDITLSFVSLINSSINPYLYIYFNKEIRCRVCFKFLNKVSNFM